MYKTKQAHIVHIIYIPFLAFHKTSPQTTLSIIFYKVTFDGYCNFLLLKILGAPKLPLSLLPLPLHSFPSMSIATKRPSFNEHILNTARYLTFCIHFSIFYSHFIYICQIIVNKLLHLSHDTPKQGQITTESMVCLPHNPPYIFQNDNNSKHIKSHKKV